MNKESLKECIPVFLAVATTLCMFGLLGLLYYKELVGGSKDILQVSLGLVIGAWVTMVNYYFGSSKGSADKTGIMADAASAAANAAPVTTTTITTPDETIETKPKETP